jgi:hypothetical protein
MTNPSLSLHDITDEEYFAAPFASNSALSALRKSPAHLRHSLAHPGAPTPAMRLGTAFHVATLEPRSFAKAWARGSEVNGRTKEGKAEKAAMQERYDADKILRPDDYDTVCAMRDKVLGHPVAGPLLSGVRAEVAAFWTDPATGIECKAKIDGLPTDGECLIDLKSTIDASPRSFAKAIYDFGYYRQGAHYLSPFADRSRFIIIACEKNPPFALGVYELSHAALQKGAEEVAGLLRLWGECIDGYGWNAEWPSYPEEIIDIDLPAWAR